MEKLKISYNNTKLSGSIQLPGSKSITNRLLVLNHILGNTIEIIHPSMADDSILLKNLLEKVSASKSSNKVIELNCNNAGTVYRFLTAVLANTEGKWILQGSERMKERPVKILVDALQSLGAEISYLKEEGFPPLKIIGKKLIPVKLLMDASVSSQFISAILLIAPAINEDMEIELSGIPGSIPYIEMTLALLNEVGIKSSMKDQHIIVRQSKPNEVSIICEPDWSSAAFWYEITALSQEAEIQLPGLTKNSLQGDAILPEIFKNLGVHTSYHAEGTLITKTNLNPLPHFEWDFSHQPDLAQSVIASCAGLNIPAIFTGLQSLKIKETDRLMAMHTELASLGYQTKIIGLDTFKIEKSTIDFSHERAITLNTWGDHRMAMSMAPLVLKHKTMLIENTSVISKSYPDFWKHLKGIGIILKHP